jgi:hypothetical protein
MSKVVPLRCQACGQIVGQVKVIDETKLDTELVDGEMDLEQHLPDCPVMTAFLNEDMKFYSISIGPDKFDGD